MDPGIRMIAWLRPDQAALVREVVDRLGAQLAGVGCPLKGRLGEVARVLESPGLDDLRATIAGESCDLLWLVDPGEFGHAPGDPSAVLDAQARGVRIVTSEPLPSSALDLAGGGWRRAKTGQAPVECVRFVPLAREGPGFVALNDLLEGFGRIHAVDVQFVSIGASASLGAHLFAAMVLVHDLLGEIESVDAAYHMPAPTGALRLLPGETLRDLHGTLSAHLRTSDGRGATLLASDRAPRWERQVTIVGEGGRVRAGDSFLEWIESTGRTGDSTPTLPSAEEQTDAAEIAHAIMQIMQDHPAQARPIPVEEALASGQAALLSVRTGQSESPETIRRMMRAG